MKVYRFSELLDLIMDYRGKTPKKLGLKWTEKSDDILAISAKNIKNQQLTNLDRAHYGNEELYNKWMKDGPIKIGDILMTSEAPLGETYIISEPLKAIISQRIFLIRPNKEVVDNWYLYALMQSDNFQKLISSKATGTTVLGIKQKELVNLKIILPDLKTQKKIGNVFKRIEEKVKLNQQINDNLLKIAQTIFSKTYFQNPNYNNWEEKTLNDISTIQNGYAFKSYQMLKHSHPNTISIFKQGNILKGGGLNPNGTKSWYPIAKTKGLDKYILKKWDCLMAMTDMKNKVAILGNTALMNEDNKYILNQRVALLRSNHYASTSPAYIFLLTNSSKFLSKLRSKAHSGVQVNLSTAAIKTMPIKIAPDNVNQEFNEKVEPLFNNMMNLDIENKILLQYKDVLLDRYF